MFACDGYYQAGPAISGVPFRSSSLGRLQIYFGYSLAIQFAKIDIYDAEPLLSSGMRY